MMQLSLKIHPGSSKRGIEIRDDGVHLFTNSRPIEGRANRDACVVLAEFFHVPKSRVSLIKGEKSRHKVFQIEVSGDVLREGPDPETVRKIQRHIREV
jgi:uncharacterized protein YggU (UPF0235/DUF167 family)